MEIQIKEISFGNKIKELTVTSYVDSLAKYRADLNNALDLKEKIPIFLDTNILLRYYSISFKSRKALLSFLTKHKKQIIITSQVQKEFIKNREDIIERYFEDTLAKLKDNFKDDIINKIKSYTDNNKILLDDFTFLEEKLSKISMEADNTYIQLAKEVEKIKEKLPQTKYEDELLSVIKEMTLLNNLTEEDIKFLHSEFDTLRKNIDVSKIKSEIGKPQRSFPGLGDLIEKPDNPYGDYILYHEMIKYIKTENKNAIFLTYDTTKGDWLKVNKEPHSHYIQSAFLATNQSLFFLDAERFFSTHLKLHFESLVLLPIDYYSPKLEYEKDFILDFIGLERIIRTIAEYVDIEKYEYKPVVSIIRDFLDRNYIDKKTRDEFLVLNKIKNLLTHAHE